MVKSFSLIIPLFRTGDFISDLVPHVKSILERIEEKWGLNTEVIFVDDACPENSYERLLKELDNQDFRSQLLRHSRNFGSFAAIMSGMETSEADFIAVMSADLQEPSSLIMEFVDELMSAEADIVIGKRLNRSDGFLTELASALFWRLYKLTVISDLPDGGVDVFGCTKQVYSELVKLEESNSSLVAQLFWLGYRRKEIGYHRLPRKYGVSAWSLRKKSSYMLNSIFSFSDLPIRLLLFSGFLGILISIGLGIVILFSKLFGLISVPGFASLTLIILSFAAINLFGLGIIGSYVWRAFENTKRRPKALVMQNKSFNGSNHVR